MDTRDGRITTADQVAMMPPEDQRYMRPMTIPPTRGQLRAGAVGRNHPCPCGSGVKFKKCCMARPPRREVPVD